MTTVTLSGHNIEVSPSIETLRSVYYEDVVDEISSFVAVGEEEGKLTSHDVVYTWRIAQNPLCGESEINLGVEVYEDEELKEIKNPGDANYSRCPMCESSSIEYGGEEPEDVVIYRVHRCTNCNTSWEERYDLVKVSITTGDVEKIEADASETESDVHEVSVDYIGGYAKSVHTMSNGLAFYNYEGNHFRVFNSYDDAMRWAKDEGDDSLVIAEFDDEDELDKYILGKTRCLYCDTLYEEDLHFACDCCGNGMCDDCYNADKEHSQHYNRPLENCETQLQRALVLQKCQNNEPEYLCQSCLDKAFADEKFKYISDNIEKLIVGKRFKDAQE